MTVTWYDRYPSLQRVDSNARTGLRLIRIVGDAVTPFNQFSVFDDDVSGTAAPTSPAGGIPQLGDFYPSDTGMIAGSRQVTQINGPSDLEITINYSRVNWGSIDTLYPGDDSNSIPPYIDLRVTTAKLVQSVPRVLAIPIANNPGIVYSYSQIVEPRTRFVTTIQATLHRTSWTVAEIQAAEDEVGAIHEDLSFVSQKTMFTGHSHQPIGQNLYRIQYNWQRMSALGSQDEVEIPIPGQAQGLRRLATPFVDPHSNLQIIARPLISGITPGQIAAEPVLIQTEPIGDRESSATTALPGLAHASIDA